MLQASCQYLFKLMKSNWRSSVFQLTLKSSPLLVSPLISRSIVKAVTYGIRQHHLPPLWNWTPSSIFFLLFQFLPTYTFFPPHGKLALGHTRIPVNHRVSGKIKCVWTTILFSHDQILDADWLLAEVTHYYSMCSSIIFMGLINIPLLTKYPLVFMKYRQLWLNWRSELFWHSSVSRNNFTTLPLHEMLALYHLCQKLGKPDLSPDVKKNN